MADSEIMKALDAQREAFAAFQEAVKTENKEAAANAEKAYNEAKDRANNLQASIDAQNKRLEKIETDLATAATLGGKNGASDLTPKQQEYQTAFASALRGNYSKDRMFSLGREAYGALVEKDNASGGFLVTPQLSSRIIGGLAVHNPMRSVATVENISSPTLEIIADPEDMDAAWMPMKRATGSSTSMRFRRISCASVPGFPALCSLTPLMILRADWSPKSQRHSPRKSATRIFPAMA